MMLTVLSLLFTVALLSLAFVLVLALLARRRGRPPVGRAVRGWTIAAATVVVVAVVASRLVRVRPWGAEWITDPRLHHALPLGAGVLAVVLLSMPLAGWSPAATATLSRRSLTSFTARWWLAVPAVVASAILIVSVLAGRASIPDRQGRYMYYEVEFGPNRIGSEIYGWHLSVPSMAVLGLLLVAMFAALHSVARPPLSDDDLGDALARRWRSRNIVTVSAGAMLLHLFTVLASLVGTASMYGGALTGGEWFTAQPPFVILRTPMLVAAWIAEFAGWFLCFAVLVAALMPARESSRRSSWQSASH